MPVSMNRSKYTPMEYDSCCCCSVCDGHAPTVVVGACKISTRVSKSDHYHIR